MKSSWQRRLFGGCEKSQKMPPICSIIAQRSFQCFFSYGAKYLLISSFIMKNNIRNDTSSYKYFKQNLVCNIWKEKTCFNIFPDISDNLKMSIQIGLRWNEQTAHTQNKRYKMTFYSDYTTFIKSKTISRNLTAVLISMKVCLFLNLHIFFFVALHM